MEPRYTNDESLPELVADLANLKREGPHWDFKREWHGNKADLLHDIICMANKAYYFSAEVSKAIGQCHRYLDVFSQAAANGLLGHEQIVAYHPEATIVIGRSFSWDSAKIKALHGLNSRLSGISIITYDYLLAQGESLVDYLSGYNTDDGEDRFDDIPF